MIKEDCFPWNPKAAIFKGFKKAEERFLEMCHTKNPDGTVTVNEKSGSCAIVVLIVGDWCFVANVGDSRALLSKNSGKEAMPLSKDHKPSEKDEY